MHSMFIPLGIALVGTGIPVVAGEQNSADNYIDKPRWHRAALELTPFISVRTTVPSAGALETHPARLASRMTVVSNPVGLVDRRGSGSLEESEGREAILLCVGRFFPQKDHATLIAAFGRIRSEFPTWRLVLLGDGALRPQIEEQIAHLGLEDAVRLVGVVSDAAAYLQRAAVLVMPSRYESFGLATAEALAVGTPAVGFADCPGTNELIQDGVNGLLVKGDDRVAALADGLRLLMNDEALRRELGRAGPASVQRYSLKSVTDSWEAILFDAVGGG